jgi:hypothetical protein
MVKMLVVYQIFYRFFLKKIWSQGSSESREISNFLDNNKCAYILPVFDWTFGLNQV